MLGVRTQQRLSSSTPAGGSMLSSSMLSSSAPSGIVHCAQLHESLAPHAHRKGTRRAIADGCRYSEVLI